MCTTMQRHDVHAARRHTHKHTHTHTSEKDYVEKESLFTCHQEEGTAHLGKQGATWGRISLYKYFLRSSERPAGAMTGGRPASQMASLVDFQQLEFSCLTIQRALHGHQTRALAVEAEVMDLSDALHLLEVASKKIIPTTPGDTRALQELRNVACCTAVHHCLQLLEAKHITSPKLLLQQAKTPINKASSVACYHKANIDLLMQPCQCTPCKVSHDCFVFVLTTTVVTMAKAFFLTTAMNFKKMMEKRNYRVWAMRVLAVFTDRLILINQVVHLLWDCFHINSENLHLSGSLEIQRANLPGGVRQCNILCKVERIVHLGQIFRAWTMRWWC